MGKKSQKRYSGTSEELVERMRAGENTKCIIERMSNENSVHNTLETLPVPEPIQGPTCRNRKPKFSVSDDECELLNKHKNRGMRVKAIADMRLLPERVVRQHLNNNCDH